MARKQGTGRKKIEIKKIQNKQHLKTTFTKRRKGLFKKAVELSTVGAGGDVAVAVITFSPYGRAYAFGNPSPETVIDRFFYDNSLCESDTESSCGEEISREDGFNWWEEPIESIEGMEINELLQFKNSIMELIKNLVNRLEDTQIRRVALRNFFA